jgi:hypothetical protein
MIWGIESFYWHRWFAWHPVRLPRGRIVWLRWVERLFRADDFPRIPIYRLPSEDAPT